MMFLGIAWGMILQLLLSTAGGIAVLILLYRAFIFLLKGRPNPHKYATMVRLENPVQGLVTIQYELPEPTNVVVQLLDAKSQLIKQLFEGDLKKGEHELEFDSATIEDGEYNYKLITHNQSMVKQMQVSNKS